MRAAFDVRAAQRGFTLLEMMVAVLVGALSVIVAAKVAQVVIRQSAQGKQASDFNTRSRLLARQLRADLRVAGYGSTGAVAVDATRPPWNLGGGMSIPINGKNAIPAVAGLNNANAIPIGGTPIRAGSDAMMVVVPNPGVAGITLGVTAAGGTSMLLDLPPNDPRPAARQPLLACGTGFIYVVDHTAPNGAGRAQLMALTSVVGSIVTTADALQFSLARGSSVSCARLSTYWVDDAGWLHRTDFGAGANPVVVPSSAPGGGPGRVFVDSNQVGNDLIAPGVADLQIAYRFSSEIYTSANLVLPPVTNLPAQWAYEGRPGNVNLMVTGAPQNLENWFEVRRVRVNALMTTHRRVDPGTPDTKTLLAREDSVPTTVDRPLRTEWVTTVETLTNLRYFDHGAPQGVRPDPF